MRVEVKSIVEPKAQSATVAVRTPSREQQQARPVIVWGRDAGHRTHSFWVEETGDNELGAEEARGIVLFAAHQLWRFITRSAPLDAEVECAWLRANERRAVGVRAELRQVGDGRAIAIVAPEAAEALESAEWRESVWLDGSIGPYLFVRRAIYSYSCGAHGMTSQEAIVFDAARRQAIDLYGKRESANVERELGARAFRALQRNGEPLFSEQAALTLHRPVFNAAGALGLEHQFTAESCYACSDDRWSSYTVSVGVQDSELPELLVEYDRATRDAVRFIQQTHPKLRVAGISLPNPELKRDFARIAASPAPLEMPPGPVYPKGR